MAKTSFHYFTCRVFACVHHRRMTKNSQCRCTPNVRILKSVCAIFYLNSPLLTHQIIIKYHMIWKNVRIKVIFHLISFEPWRAQYTKLNAILALASALTITANETHMQTLFPSIACAAAANIVPKYNTCASGNIFFQTFFQLFDFLSLIPLLGNYILYRYIARSVSTSHFLSLSMSPMPSTQNRIHSWWTGKKYRELNKKKVSVDPWNDHFDPIHKQFLIEFRRCVFFIVQKNLERYFRPQFVRACVFSSLSNDRRSFLTPICCASSIIYYIFIVWPSVYISLSSIK